MKQKNIKKNILLIKIIGDQVTLFLLDNEDKKTAELKWKDRRDLSEKLLVKIDQLLKKNKLSLSDISKINFKSRDCGFMAGQIGKITAEVLSFNLSSRATIGVEGSVNK